MVPGVATSGTTVAGAAVQRTAMRGTTHEDARRTVRQHARMRRFLVLAATCLLLSGCGSQPPAAEPELSPSSSAGSPTAEPAPDPDPTEEPAGSDPAVEGFLLNVRHVPALDEMSDADLLAAADDVCATLDGGGGYDEAVAPLLAAGLSADEVLVLASTAVFEFCQEHDLVMEGAVVGVDPGKLATEPEGDNRSRFLAQVRQDPFYSEDVTDDALLMLGTTMCDGFTRGDTLEVTLGYMSGIPDSSARAFLSAATQHICPEHADKL